VKVPLFAAGAAAAVVVVVTGVGSALCVLAALAAAVAFFVATGFALFVVAGATAFVGEDDEADVLIPVPVALIDAPPAMLTSLDPI
jgi:hypothetical protein